MSERNKDDLAAALAGLHSGEHHEPEEGHDAHDVEAHLHDAGHPADPAHRRLCRNRPRAGGADPSWRGR